MAKKNYLSIASARSINKSISSALKNHEKKKANLAKAKKRLAQAKKREERQKQQEERAKERAVKAEERKERQRQAEIKRMESAEDKLKRQAKASNRKARREQRKMDVERKREIKRRNKAQKEQNKQLNQYERETRKRIADVKRQEREAIKAKRILEAAEKAKQRQQTAVAKTFDEQFHKKYKEQADDPLTRINDTLDYIKNNKNLNYNDQLGQKLEQAMRSMMNNMDLDFSPGDDTDYYTIDKTWDGTTANLIKHVKFKKIVGSDAEELLDDVANSSWGNDKLHDKMLREARDAAWDTITSNPKHKGLNIDVTGDMLEQLQQVMQSSDMWAFVSHEYKVGGKKYDHWASNQAYDKWEEMEDKMEDLLNTNKVKQGDLDTLLAMLKNPTHYSFAAVTKYIDGLIDKYTK